MITPRADLNRRWAELLQELRVAQTGVQILAGFLLMVPFSNAFDALDQMHKQAYIAVLLTAVTATVLLLSPVALHRVLFDRGQRPELVGVAHHLAAVGLLLLGPAYVGAVWFVADVVLGERLAALIALVLLGLILLLWAVLPAIVRGRESTGPLQDVADPIDD